MHAKLGGLRVVKKSLAVEGNTRLGRKVRDFQPGWKCVLAAGLLNPGQERIQV